MIKEILKLALFVQVLAILVGFISSFFIMVSLEDVKNVSLILLAITLASVPIEYALRWWMDL